MARSAGYNPLLKTYPDSERINAVSEGAELLYVRLIAKTDDHGQYWGDAAFVWAKLFTHRMDTVSIDEIESRLQELEKVGLLVRYQAAGKRYLQLIGVHKTARYDRKCSVEFPDGPEPVQCRSKHCHLHGNSGSSDGEPLVDQTDNHWNTPHPNPHPKTNPPPPPQGNQPDLVAAAESFLISAGVQHPRRAVESAFSRGATPTDIEAIASHYAKHPGAWEPGALCHRVKNFHPDQPPDQGWPKPSAKYRDQQRAQKSQEPSPADTRQAAEKESRRLEAEQREREYGPIWDAWSDEERAEFIARNGLRVLLGKTREESARRAVIMATMAKLGKEEPCLAK